MNCMQLLSYSGIKFYIQNNMKKAFYISFLFNVLIILFIAGKRYYYSYGASAGNASKVNFFDQWDKMRASTYASLPIDTSDIIFLGNSLTEAFPVTEIFGPHFKNRGIGGNQTSHILHRVGDIAISRPRKIFLEGGVNDLNAGCSVDSIFKNFLRIFDSIAIIAPKTKLYVQSIFPTCYEYSRVNDSIIALNKKLSRHCDLKGLTYIDIYSKIAEGSKLDSALTEDGIHLNAKGYTIWRQAIEQYLK